MGTTGILPGASDMSNETRKCVRPATAPTVTPRVTQRPYLAPRLATTTSTAETPKVLSPKLAGHDNAIRSPISPNVTPRSAARKSRNLDSIPTTPLQSKVSTPVSTYNRYQLSTEEIKHHQVDGSDTSRGRNTQTSASQFFLASDAVFRWEKSPVSQHKSSSFIYANGKEEDPEPRECDRRLSRSPGPRLVGSADDPPKRRISSRSSPAVSRTSFEARFVPANRSPPNSSVSKSDLRILSRTIRGATPTPKSPLKAFAYSQSATPTIDRRRSSIDTSSSPSESPHSVPNRAIDSSREQDNATEEMNQSVPTLRPFTSPFSPCHHIYLVPSSPTGKRNEETADEASAAIIDARRERKILDLEISNSSLLAFNRSLERDNRKLKTEIRRYRRATNAGIFSHTTRPFDESNVEDNDRDSTSELSEPDSPTETQTEEQSARDQRRLQKDFSRHRQLLDDSRQMNLSIKHCLDVTDYLIAEARQALKQAAILTDDDLKSKVLQVEESGQDLEQSKGLLSPVREASIVWKSPADIHSVEKSSRIPILAD